MELRRDVNETVKQYKVRLCQNKDKYGLSWTDIAGLVSKEIGEVVKPDTIKRWWRTYRDGYEDGLRSNITAEQYIEEIERRKLDLQKQKYQYQDQKREFNNILRKIARAEHIKDEIVKHIEKIAQQKPLVWEPIWPAGGPLEGIALWSDWHKGLFAENFWNQLNDDVFRARVEHLVNRTIFYSRQQKLSKLHVFILGDMVHGIIHITSRIMSTEDVIQQTMSVSEILAESLAKVASHVPEVYVYCARGNHDRVIANKEDALNKENFMEIIPWYLKARLAHIQNLTFIENKFDDEVIVADVAGSVVFGVHGHKDKPENVVQNLTLMFKRIPDYVVMGHYHHHYEREFQGVEVIVNGTLSGVDEYALNIRKINVPHQKLLIFEPGYGRICTYNIRLDKLN